MMIQVEASALREVLNSAKPAIGKGAQQLAVQCVRLRAEKGRLWVVATDLTLTIEASAPCSEGDLDVLVRPELLLAFVAKSSNVVSILVKDNDCVFESGRSMLKLRCAPLRDWPALPESPEETTAVPVATLAIIGAASYATLPPSEKGRPELQGVCVADSRVWGTDSRRAVRIDLDVELPQMVLPAALLRHALALFDEGEVRVGCDGRRAFFRGEDRSASLALLGEKYPEMDGLVRASSPHFLEVDRKALLDALELCSIDNEHRFVDMDFEDQSFILSGERQDVGRVESVIDCDTDVDWPMRWNGRFLADLLEACSTERVRIGLVDAFKLGQVEEPGRLHMLMPIRR